MLQNKVTWLSTDPGAVYMEESRRMSVLKVSWAIYTWIYPYTGLLYANSAALFTPQCTHLSDLSVGAVGESFYLIRPDCLKLPFNGLWQTVQHHVEMMDYHALVETHRSPKSQPLTCQRFPMNSSDEVAVLRGLFLYMPLVHYEGCMSCLLKTRMPLNLNIVLANWDLELYYEINRGNYSRRA